MTTYPGVVRVACSACERRPAETGEETSHIGEDQALKVALEQGWKYVEWTSWSGHEQDDLWCTQCLQNLLDDPSDRFLQVEKPDRHIDSNIKYDELPMIACDVCHKTEYVENKLDECYECRDCHETTPVESLQTYEAEQYPDTIQRWVRVQQKEGNALDVCPSCSHTIIQNHLTT